MKLRIPQNINASTKDNQAFSQNNGRLESTQYLLQQISSQLFMTHGLFLHSQFPRNWSVLFDTDHGQAWLLIPEFRQGSEDTVFLSFFFFLLAEFSLSFSRHAIQLKKDPTGPSCITTASSSLSWWSLQLSMLYHRLWPPPPSVKIWQWILPPSVYFSMAKQPMGLIGGRMFYKSLPWPTWSKWKKPSLKGLWALTCKKEDHASAVCMTWAHSKLPVAKQEWRSRLANPTTKAEMGGLGDAQPPDVLVTHTCWVIIMQLKNRLERGRFAIKKRDWSKPKAILKKVFIQDPPAEAFRPFHMRPISCSPGMLGTMFLIPTWTPSNCSSCILALSLLPVMGTRCFQSL